MNDCIFGNSSVLLVAATIFSLPHIPNYFVGEAAPRGNLSPHPHIRLHGFVDGFVYGIDTEEFSKSQSNPPSPINNRSNITTPNPHNQIEHQHPQNSNRHMLVMFAEFFTTTIISISGELNWKIKQI